MTDAELKTVIHQWIEEALKSVNARLEKLENNLGSLEGEVETINFASENHYHDDYAHIDHVKRSENSFNNQLYQIKNDLSNLEYRASDIERKAERAQSAADDARRSARGGW